MSEVPLDAHRGTLSSFSLSFFILITIDYYLDGCASLWGGMLSMASALLSIACLDPAPSTPNSMHTCHTPLLPLEPCVASAGGGGAMWASDHILVFGVSESHDTHRVCLPVRVEYRRVQKCATVTSANRFVFQKEKLRGCARSRCTFRWRMRRSLRKWPRKSKCHSPVHKCVFSTGHLAEGLRSGARDTPTHRVRGRLH